MKSDLQFLRYDDAGAFISSFFHFFIFVRFLFLLFHFLLFKQREIRRDLSVNGKIFVFYFVYVLKKA